jgi:hypothetical protein
MRVIIPHTDAGGSVYDQDRLWRAESVLAEFDPGYLKTNALRCQVREYRSHEPVWVYDLNVARPEALHDRLSFIRHWIVD